MIISRQHASDVALVSFTFPSLGAYEQYRKLAITDPEYQAAYAYAKEVNCIRRYERR